MPADSMHRMIQIAGLACALVVSGCGGGSDGQPIYRVSGAVTFDGQPIPQGTIVFSPDLSKRNDGPQGVAPIKDGKYDTQGGQGMGAVGGAMKVSVTGLSADA